MLKCKDCGNTEDFVREKLVSIWNDGKTEQEVTDGVRVIRCDRCNSLNVDVDYPESCKKYIITTKRTVWARTEEQAKKLIEHSREITTIIEVKE